MAFLELKFSFTFDVGSPLNIAIKIKPSKQNNFHILEIFVGTNWHSFAKHFSTSQTET